MFFCFLAVEIFQKEQNKLKLIFTARQYSLLCRALY